MSKRRYFILIQCIIPLLLGVAGCGVLREKSSPQVVPATPLTPEEAQTQLNELGADWLYGPGLGTTILNVGAVALYPPYAIYVLGNAAIGLAGYEELYVTKLLPDEDEKEFNQSFDTIVSGPGRVAAFVGEEDYRTREEIETKRKSRGEVLASTQSDVSSH